MCAVAADEPTPDAPALNPVDAQPLADTGAQPKRGGLGGILDAILKGLQPVRRVRRRRLKRRRTTRTSTRRTTRSRSSASSGGGSGPLLALRYHSGGGDNWTTTRVAFGKQGNRIAVISSADAEWWHHIRTASPVQVRIRNQWVDGRARLVSRSDDTYARAVGVFIDDHSRAAAERLGVAMDSAGRLDHGPRQSGDAVVVWIEVDAE
jgi:hypothetical protein